MRLYQQMSRRLFVQWHNLWRVTKGKIYKSRLHTGMNIDQGWIAISVILILKMNVVNTPNKNKNSPCNWDRVKSLWFEHLVNRHRFADNLGTWVLLDWLRSTHPGRQMSVWNRQGYEYNLVGPEHYDRKNWALNLHPSRETSLSCPSSNPSLGLEA